LTLGTKKNWLRRKGGGGHGKKIDRTLGVRKHQDRDNSGNKTCPKKFPKKQGKKSRKKFVGKDRYGTAEQRPLSSTNGKIKKLLDQV